MTRARKKEKGKNERKKHKNEKKNEKRGERSGKAQAALEAMLTLAAYAALIAAFVYASRSAVEKNVPAARLAAGEALASQECALIEAAQANARHSAFDAPSIQKIKSAVGGRIAVETKAGEASVECRAAARSQGVLKVKQYAKEQA